MIHDASPRHRIAAAVVAPNPLAAHWLDLREDQASRYYEGIALQEEEIARIAATVHDLLTERLRELDLGPHLVDEIDGDLRNLLELDSAQAPNEFFETLERAYLAGGWPCGWDDAYPNGRLVVFNPPKSAPTDAPTQMRTDRSPTTCNYPMSHQRRELHASSRPASRSHGTWRTASVLATAQ